MSVILIPAVSLFAADASHGNTSMFNHDVTRICIAELTYV